METHDHQSSEDAHPPSGAVGENMTTQVTGTDSVSPDAAPQGISDHSLRGQQAQASPADAAQTASVDPSTHTAMPDQQGQAVTQSAQAQTPDTASAQPDTAAQAMPGGQAASVDPSAYTAMPDQGQTVPPSAQAQAAGQQAQFQPNVIMDPATGQLYYAMPQGQPVQPPPQNGQYVYYTTQAPPEPPPAPESRQPDYAQIVKSVEEFAEGDATVADVVKTLWTETSQDDQFWKGAVVGAAAAVLLTSGPVRGAMGKTFGSLFGQNGADAAASASSGPDVDPKTT
ncbi:hypothetical protein [uncultured Desulfobacter sp.]|uniref:hypothetical protein n=1 Tax=uncultured Desulfobacter sp. TaxID=240139 RepID=UPI002AA821D0|nr:hypothetical protein [uncultured Desulfobacter sp.]